MGQTFTMVRIGGAMVRSRVFYGGIVGALVACAAPASLLRIDEEAPGANCANGGSAVHAGQDANENGQLEDEEILDTSFVCNGDDGPGVFGPVLVGSYTIENEFDIEAIIDVEEITGSLTITGNGYDSLSLPNLIKINGDLIIDLPFDSAIDYLDLPSLLEISQKLSTSIGTPLETLDFPSLVGLGFLEVSFNVNLKSISIENATELQSIAIESSFALSDIRLSSLQVCDSVRIQSNPVLPACQVQNLLDQLVTPPSLVQVSGNDNTGVCP
jgi:hypothetical protein